MAIDESSQRTTGSNFGSIAYPDRPSDLKDRSPAGAAGTLYGADNIGGIVKVETRDPSTSGFSGQVQVTGEADS